MKKTIAMLTMFLSLMLVSATAIADSGGGWVKMDAKVPLVKVDENYLNLRLTPELVFLNSAGGLSQTTARAGFHHACANWFSLTLNGVSQTVGTSQDLRPEVQPEFNWDVNSNLAFKDRSRLSYRALDSAVGNRWVYANELKVIVTPDNAPVFPWVAYEGFVDVSNGNMNQHQLRGGLGRKVSDAWTLNLAYMFRTSKALPEWSNDHFVFVSAEN